MSHSSLLRIRNECKRKKSAAASHEPRALQAQIRVLKKKEQKILETEFRIARTVAAREDAQCQALDEKMALQTAQVGFLLVSGCMLMLATSACTYVCMCIRSRAHTFVCMCIRLPVLTFVCMYIRLRALAFACTHVWVYIHFCVHTFACTYVGVYIRLHVHTFACTYVRGKYSQRSDGRWCLLVHCLV